MIIGSMISEHAATKAEATALVFDRESITWQKLEELLKRAAGWLEHASPHCKSVALNLPNCPALAVFFLAGIRLGYEMQIFDTQWPLAHTREMIARLSPDLIVADHDGDVAAGALLPKEALDFSGLEKWLPPHDPIFQWRSVEKSASFYVGFTSGSTGLPKGYRRNHHSWIKSFDVAREEFGLASNHVIAAHGALTHSLYLFALAWAMHEGATCLLARSFKPNSLVEAAKLHGSNVMFGVPAQLGMLSRYLQESAKPALPDLRWLISSGSKWSSREDPALRAHMRHARFAEFYGASETSFVTVAVDGEPVPEGSVGRAFGGVRISIRNENDEVCQSGVDGRIFVASEMLFDGYAGGDEEIARISDGSICVGDIGHLDADGYLFLSGRENRMIVTSGKNLFPEEVERVLEEHFAVLNAAVISVADEKRGERLIGILSLRAPERLMQSEIIAHARVQLPLFKVPREYWAVSEWPFTRSGKSDFQKLKQLLERGELERLP